MVEFLMDLTTGFEFLSFVASLVFCFRKDTPRYLKLFPVFLFITLIVELIATILRFNNISNMPLYNFFSAFEILFYLFVLYHVIMNQHIKKIILYSSLFYPIVSIADILSHKIKAFHFITYSLGAILLVCFCVCYFYEFFKKSIYQKPNREPPFWICLGLLVFYSCTMPLWTAWNLLHATPFELNMFVIIVGSTNYFLYSSITISFFIFYKLQKVI